MIPASEEMVILIRRSAGLAGAACMELVARVAQLRPEDAMVEAMLRGWRAQQLARGLSVGGPATSGAPIRAGRRALRRGPAIPAGRYAMITTLAAATPPVNSKSVSGARTAASIVAA
jgi:hypothetical protein